MRGVNKAILIGTLGRDPEVRYAQDGRAIANLSLATNERWKDKAGEAQERTEWHRVVLFGKTAEIAEKYLKKGDIAYIEGKLQTRKWQGNDGQDRYTTEIVVDITGTMQLLSPPKRDGWDSTQHQQSSGHGTGANRGGGRTDYQAPPQRQSRPQPQATADYDDDIPF